ncbi:nitrogen permease regulator 3 [Podospora australis]|uniref:Nitrogen permease regulator 3 n=1 Tax=Podospora australis TaxID=1536484 RepID=A0AAN6X3F9_9PEZI|nr:nitrogen permease regulator 3 [Podospora australis]
MALPVLPNPSNFMGVALVINRSRDGPRFVFHYPRRKVPPAGVCGNSDGGDDVEDEEEIMARRPSRDTGIETSGSSELHAPELANWNYDDHFVTESGTQIVPWEYVAGYPTKDLENILTPNRAYHKRQFQVSLDPIYCVSYPIYVPENGVWKKKKNKKKEKSSQRDSGVPGKDDEETAPNNNDVSAKGATDRGTTDGELTGPNIPPPAESEDREKKASMTMFNLVFFLRPKKHEVKDLVDIMYSHIIKKINKAYKYCQERSDFVWKESKKILALKDKGREDKRKMSLLWEEILATSSLAASMQDLYEAISQNRIAALQLDTIEGMITHSVQIPIPFHVSDLPQDGEQGQAGLWLTTANSLMGDDAIEELGFLDKNFALLLMMDEKRIVAELQNDPDEQTLAMIEFVRHCKATLSFYQVGQQSTNVLTPAQVRKFAQHFIFWRRAIAIPPLHARDMYIVSPNCDLRKLPQATSQWARQFPLSPPLPNFLAELSVTPRPYKLHCPSKAHRPVYMSMLAWLMRGGWVTQLCTFAYVVVWPEIIYEVEYHLEAEQIKRSKRAQELGRNPGSVESDDAATVITSPTDLAALGDAAVAPFLPMLEGSSGSTDLAASTTSTVFGDLTLSHSQSIPSIRSSGRNMPSFSPFSPTTSPHTRQPPSVDPSVSSPTSPQDIRISDSAPTPAEQIAEKARLERIADKVARELAERATNHARKPPPQQTAHPSIRNTRHLEGLSPHIILDAKQATGKESLYLSAIGKRFDDAAAEAKARRAREGGGLSTGRPTNVAGNLSGDARDDGSGSMDWEERVANAWPLFWKYFNGRSAMERIALQEDMKRKDVWNLLTAMSEYLICVRHW